MSEFFKMDVFFVVATAGTAVLSILSALVLWKVFRILEHAERIAGEVAEESAEIRKDIDLLRRDLRAGKSRLRSLFAFVRHLGNRRSRRISRNENAP